MNNSQHFFQKAVQIWKACIWAERSGFQVSPPAPRVRLCMEFLKKIMENDLIQIITRFCGDFPHYQ